MQDQETTQPAAREALKNSTRAKLTVAGVVTVILVALLREVLASIGVELSDDVLNTIVGSVVALFASMILGRSIRNTPVSK